jgi:hypothetical protein
MRVRIPVAGKVAGSGLVACGFSNIIVRGHSEHLVVIVSSFIAAVDNSMGALFRTKLRGSVFFKAKNRKSHAFCLASPWIESGDRFVSGGRAAREAFFRKCSFVNESHRDWSSFSYFKAVKPLTSRFFCSSLPNGQCTGPSTSAQKLRNAACLSFC